jgi:hypothetical protein
MQWTGTLATCVLSVKYGPCDAVLRYNETWGKTHHQDGMTMQSRVSPWIALGRAVTLHLPRLFQALGSPRAHDATSPDPDPSLRKTPALPGFGFPQRV